MKIDLHIHSTASDGLFSPEQIVMKAKEVGLSTISITDHESINGYYEAIKFANILGIQVIPGLELSTHYKNTEIHLLGYCFDPTNTVLLQKLQELRRQRTVLAKKMVEKLNYFGINLEWDQIINYYSHDVAISKGHIINSLFRTGIINRKENYREFINRYFSISGLAYLSFWNNPLEEAITLIKQAGGIPVLAHPGLICNDDLVKEIIDNFPVGLEVYYFYYGDKREEWIKKYESMANNRGIIKTGGSDFHGVGLSELGGIDIPQNILNNLICRKI